MIQGARTRKVQEGERGTQTRKDHLRQYKCVKVNHNRGRYWVCVGVAAAIFETSRIQQVSSKQEEREQGATSDNNANSK